MIDQRHESTAVEAPMPECWRRIGVAGDRSCPELEAFIHCRNCPVLAAAARTFFDRGAPAGYLDDWRAILEEPTAAPATDTTSVLVFRIGGEWLALPTAVLVEVTPLRTLHRLPHRSGGVLAGIVNIRGQLQLSASLHDLIGIAEESSAGGDATLGPATARLLVVERAAAEAADRWVFGVDEVAGVHRVTKGMLRAVPSTVGHAGGRLSSALFAWQDRTVALLDEARVFDGLRDRIAG
ncbi:MAG: chemotaxis protein CheW [Planctomycetaceae bacterium]|jgi:chemotaxis-related protein WspD|nr:chemotaxis protein CheW [Planctomycetaceae bacterium]